MQVRGRVVYFGPTGSACITHIKSISTTLHFQPSKQQRSGTSLLQHGKDTNDLDIEVASDRHAKGLVGAQHRMDESMASMNPAEWVMDVFTQADRQGKGDDFADAYNASELNLVRLPEHALSCDFMVDSQQAVMLYRLMWSMPQLADPTTHASA